VLRGNLAPDGAVLKPSAASPNLMRHRGPAVVFHTTEHYKQRIVDPDLDVDEDSVLVLQNCGPKGSEHGGGWEYGIAAQTSSSRR
jgi:L-arabonate dehydrase